MTLGNLLSVKSVLLRKVRAKFLRPHSRAKLFSYWKNPKDNWNNPELYLEGKERSEYLVNLVRKYVADNHVSILDLGCNVGRNMNHLFEAGFTNLSGVEINTKALDILKARFPKLAANCIVFNSSIEDWVDSHSSLRFDVIYSMAVLEHLHRESEWVFPYLSRMVNRYLVTVEDEKQVSARHFPRKYKKIFEGCGMVQLEEMNCGDIQGLDSNFNARIFTT